MDKITVPMKLFIIMICITAFFFNVIGNGYFILVLCLIPVCFKIFALLPKTSYNSSAMLILFISIAYISSSIAPLRSESNKFIFMMIAFFITKLVLEDSFGWQNFFSPILFFIAAISVVATILSPVIPDMMLKLAEMLFSGDAYITYSRLFSNGSYGGIYGQTGLNAYVISIFIAFVVTDLFSEKKAKLNYLLLAVGIIALLLTKKRSFLLANVIAGLVLFFQSKKSEKNKSKKTQRILLLVIVAVLVIKYAPATQGLLEKMSALENSGDITNGREATYMETIKIWKENPVLGIGINNMPSVYGLSTHNVYLQLLAETGIVGALAYILLLWTSYIRSAKNYRYVLTDDSLISGKRTIYGVSIYMQVIFIVYSFFGNPVYGINFMLPYIVFVGVMDSYQKYRQRVME